MNGDADIGLLIHEGQITYGDWGLAKILDYGEVWEKDTDGLPLPLGLDLVRRDLGRELAGQISDTLRRSIAAALANEADALEYALQYGRDLDRRKTDEFVGMYVNDWTIDFGERGKAAVAELLRRGYECGLLPQLIQPEFV
jgi:1,4-dihydroxy-6-naphthoate synthase